MVKKFLDERQVAFDYRNVLHDDAAAHEFLALGGRVPPLVLIDGQAVYGYRPDELEAALVAAGLM